MRKTLVLILFALLSFGFLIAQGAETFENHSLSGTSYVDGSFVGDGGVTWNYIQVTGEQSYPITNKGLILRRIGSNSKVYSSIVSGGIGTFSCQLRKAFTGAGDRQAALYINDTFIANSVVFGSASGGDDTVVNFVVNDINITGNIVIEVRNIQGTGTTNRQITIDNISWTGYTGGAPTPTINVSGTLSAFSTFTGTPSAAQSYTLSGSNLTGNISVAAPAGFVLSTDQSTWTTPLSLASSFNGLVYVRLTGETAGEYSGNITHNSTDATEVTLAASGTVTDPVPAIVLTGTLNEFSAITGTPSASQSYTVQGQFLTDPIAVTPPTGYELSTDNSTWSSSLSLPNTYNGLVYVRLIGTTAGTYSGDILHSSLLVLESKAVSGAVTDPAGPTTFLEENFAYEAGTALTANGWIRHSGIANNGPVVANEGLVYAGYPPASGLAGRIQGNGDDVHKNLSEAQTSGSVYNSFLINVTSATEAGDYVYHFATNVDNTTDLKGRFFVSRDSLNHVRFGLTKSTGVGTSVAWTGYDYALNTTYLAVLKYELISGTANDIVTAWINPEIGPTEPAAQLSAATTETDIGTAGIGSVAIRQSNASLTAIFDGIRVTNDWALLWDGTPPPTPVIYAGATELDPLAAIVNTPSDEMRSYALYGTDLQGPITIIAPNGFQVSTSETEGWAAQIAVPSSFNSTIYVRMFPEVSGEFSGNITHNSPNAAQVTVAVSGEAIEPPTTWNVTANLTAFSSEAGTASAAQSYTLSATNATTNLELTVDTPFEISTSETSDFGSSLSLASTFNGTIWVRMNPTAAGEFTGNVTHNTTNASPYELALSGTATLAPGNYATDLFFSEYIEGSSNNKALEIFNGTGVPVDLGSYKVYLYSNGSSTPSSTYFAVFAPGTMLAHGDVYVIANANANSAILTLADVTSTVTYFSGDDAVALVKVVSDQDVFVDIFGRIGEDPGSAWTGDGGYSTGEKTLVRKPTIIQGITSNPVSGFPTLTTEWDVYAQDTITYLGSHVFTPGMEVAEAPVMNPTGAVYSAPINVSISTTTPGATIYYTTDGSLPSDTNGTSYTTAIPVSSTTTIKAITYATGYTPSSVTTENYIFPTQVASIAALRAMPTGTTVYQLSGEAILTFQQGATRYTKYIQDATAAIVIDDPAHVITTTYNLYDGITGVAGTLGVYNGLLQFTPVADPGAATSTGNVVVPEVRTLASLTSADQGKLIKVENVMIDATLVNFPSSASNINVTDPSGAGILRTFASTDYVSTAIPTVAQDIICLAGEFNGTMQISPRFLADFSNHPLGQLDTPAVTISATGTTINLNWEAITGANSYLVEGSSDPYGTFTTIETVTTNSWSGAAEGMKFFRVTAQP